MARVTNKYEKESPLSESKVFEDFSRFYDSCSLYYNHYLNVVLQEKALEIDSLDNPDEYQMRFQLLLVQLHFCLCVHTHLFNAYIDIQKEVCEVDRLDPIFKLFIEDIPCQLSELSRTRKMIQNEYSGVRDDIFENDSRVFANLRRYCRNLTRHFSAILKY